MIKKILPIIIGLLLVSAIVVPIVNSPSGNSKTLEVYVIAGQSQGVWEFSKDLDVVNAEVPSPEKTAYYYGNSNPVLWQLKDGQPDWDTTYTTYGIHEAHYANGWIIGDIEPSLAYGITKASNHDVYLINVCEKGRTLEYLNTDGKSFIEEVLTHALDEIPKNIRINYGGCVFMHGEADATTAVDTYVEEFETFKGFIQSYGFKTFYIVPTVPANAGNAIEAQEKIAESDKDVILTKNIAASFTVENGLLKSDGVHYTQKGDDLIGAEVCSYLPQSLPDNSFELLQLIPIMFVLALIIMAVRVAITKSND